MCGIAGAFAFNQFKITPEYLNQMRDTMVHRGPDGAGTWNHPEQFIGLAHRRLSIIDLSRNASQPMQSADGQLVLSFNGEIYNHKALRQQLIQLGYTNWQTDHSDTEVILQAYRAWGIDCLQHFRGMFAFALWDNQQRCLWLVRDRLGIKPLYYSNHHQRITFASEIKALLTDPEQARAVNETAFYHYLSFLTTPAPDTLFAGIRKLPAGCWLRITANGEQQCQRYWEVFDHTQPLTDHSEEQIAELIRDELRQAVRLRQESDVPVGVFLSGGIDSSTNAALFSENSSQPVRTYSIGYHGDYKSYQNELHYANDMARFVKADHKERLLDESDLIRFLPQMITLQDEPIADPVCVPVYYVSELARQNGTIVCQVGEGADELFWGYPSWKVKLRLAQLNQWPVPTLFKKAGLLGLKTMGRQSSWEYEMLRRGAAGQAIFWGGAEAFTEHSKQQLLSPRLQQQFKSLSSWDALSPIYQRFKQNAWEDHPLNWMSYVDLNLRLPELLLMRVDKMSMGVSLEGRVPFLDHKLVELAMSIPASLKTRHGNLKHMLKKSVRGIIPDAIIDRPKQGFGVPVYEWFFSQLGEQTKTTLTQFCKETDYLSPKTVDNLLNQHQGPQVWYLLNFALWWQAYIR